MKASPPTVLKNRQRRIHAEIGGVNAVIVEQESEGNHDSAADDERQHMGNAVHEVLVERAPDGIPRACRRGGRRRTLRRMVNGGLAVENRLNEFLGLVDTVGDARNHDGLAVEARHFHVFVRRHNDTVATGDFVRRQDVFGAAGAVRLDFRRQSHFGAGLFKVRRRHVRVGDARRAGRDRQNAVAAHSRAARRRFLFGEALAPEMLLFRLVEHIEELFFRLGGTELFHEILFREQVHQPREHIDVQTAVHRRGNHKEQVALLVVVGVVLNPLGGTRHRQTGRRDHVRFRVRNHNAVADIRGILLFTGENGLCVGVLIGNVAVRELQVYHLVDEFGLVGGFDVQCRRAPAEQLYQTHKSLSFLSADSGLMLIWNTGKPVFPVPQSVASSSSIF